MSVSVVLDPSAIRAYARGSIAVGEMFVILGEEANVAGLPAVAMAQAFGDTERLAMNQYLVDHPRIEVVALDASNVEEVGLLSGLPSFGHAHAVVAARQLATFLMTEEPDTFDGFFDKDMIIPM